MVKKSRKSARRYKSNITLFTPILVPHRPLIEIFKRRAHVWLSPGGSLRDLHESLPLILHQGLASHYRRCVALGVRGAERMLVSTTIQRGSISRKPNSWGPCLRLRERFPPREGQQNAPPLFSTRSVRFSIRFLSAPLHRHKCAEGDGDGDASRLAILFPFPFPLSLLSFERKNVSLSLSRTRRRGVKERCTYAREGNERERESWRSGIKCKKKEPLYGSIWPWGR